MEEAEDYGQITGGSSSESQFSDLKVTGSIDFSGSKVPIESDAIRVYYEFTNQWGEHWKGAVITGFLSVGETELNGALITGSADIEGMLSVATSGPGYPLTIPADTQAVETAANYLRALGLTVNAAPSSYKTASSHTFERDDSWLTIANWLLTSADFSSCTTDAMGIVQMQPYIEPTEREPLWTFKDDDTSFFFPEIKESDNRADTPNIVNIWYEDDTTGLLATARNDDKQSQSSTVSRKREVQLNEEVTELTGNTTEEMLSNLQAAAKKKLTDNSTRIEYVEVKCVFIPAQIGDSALVDYQQAQKEFSGSITAKEVDFGHGGETTITMRRLLRPDFTITTTGEIAWQLTQTSQTN